LASSIGFLDKAKTDTAFTVSKNKCGSEVVCAVGKDFAVKKTTVDQLENRYEAFVGVEEHGKKQYYYLNIFFDSQEFEAKNASQELAEMFFCGFYMNNKNHYKVVYDFLNGEDEVKSREIIFIARQLLFDTAMEHNFVGQKFDEKLKDRESMQDRYLNGDFTFWM
jgi:hypothetical protein